MAQQHVRCWRATHSPDAALTWRISTAAPCMAPRVGCCQPHHGSGATRDVLPPLCVALRFSRQELIVGAAVSVVGGLAAECLRASAHNTVSARLIRARLIRAPPGDPPALCIQNELQLAACSAAACSAAQQQGARRRWRQRSMLRALGAAQVRRGPACWLLLPPRQTAERMPCCCAQHACCDAHQAGECGRPCLQLQLAQRRCRSPLLQQTATAAATRCSSSRSLSSSSTGCRRGIRWQSFRSCQPTAPLPTRCSAGHWLCGGTALASELLPPLQCSCTHIVSCMLQST